jgi:hypothetical protein
MMLALGLSYIAFIMSRNIPSIPSFFRAFIMKGGEFCQRLLLHLLRGSCGFCSCFCLYAVLCLWIYVYRSIFVSLEWNWLGGGVWCFWCVVEFCLPVFGMNPWLYIH